MHGTALTQAQRSQRWRDAHSATVAAYNEQRRNERASLLSVAERIDIPQVDNAQRKARVILRRNAKAQRDQLKVAQRQLSEQLKHDIEQSNIAVLRKHADLLISLADANTLGQHIADYDNGIVQ
ncbi:MAG TPA: hypothetical protein VKR59_07775 [Terriglobales bacterium]|nr:hypothetical protein [Terriglobales bacterium]